MDKTLESLLEEGLVIVLGAGASVDYGFPNWNDLKIELEAAVGMDVSSKDELSQQFAEKWVAILSGTDFSTSTIDQVISESYSNLVERHWIVDHMKGIIAECEKIDKSQKSDVKWIDRLSDSFIEIIEMAHNKNGLDEDVVKLLDNTRIVTLNYDRCFEYHFFPKIQRYLNSKAFTDKDFLQTYDKQLRDFFLVYHPHGSLGFLSLPDDAKFGNPITAVNVYDGNKYTNYSSNSTGFVYGAITNRFNHIELVGEGDLTKNYSRLNNEFINDLSNCLIVGISNIGMNGCRINWNNYNRVFYSAATKPDDCPEHIECLGMYASAIVDLLVADHQ